MVVVVVAAMVMMIMMMMMVMMILQELGFLGHASDFRATGLECKGMLCSKLIPIKPL